MSSDLERRLSRALRELPAPARDATERARRAALAVLPRSARRYRFGSRRTLVVAGATLALLGAGAAALAAIGVEVRLGPPKRQQRPPSGQLLELPRGAHGFAVFSGGKLWLTTRAGVRIQGLGVSAVSLSPRARYVAVGLGRQLVAMAPSGRHAWARTTRGRILSAAWSPDGLKIAYVVERVSARAAHRNELRLIEGDGDHDRLLDVGVAAVPPAWRADSLALAYAGVGGRAIVYDLGHLSRKLVQTRCTSPGRVRALAFAPVGRKLAIATTSAVVVAAQGARPAACDLLPEGRLLTGIAWLDGHSFVTAERLSGRGAPPGRLSRWLTRSGSGLSGGGGGACTPARILTIAGAPTGEALAVGLANRQGVLDVRELKLRASGGRCAAWPTSQRLLRLRRGGALQLAWR
jgi:hypothetical protein